MEEIVDIVATLNPIPEVVDLIPNFQRYIHEASVFIAYSITKVIPKDEPSINTWRLTNAMLCKITFSPAHTNALSAILGKYTKYKGANRMHKRMPRMMPTTIAATPPCEIPNLIPKYNGKKRTLQQKS